jgi:hypothetical protein
MRSSYSECSCTSQLSELLIELALPWNPSIADESPPGQDSQEEYPVISRKTVVTINQVTVSPKQVHSGAGNRSATIDPNLEFTILD